MNIMKIKTCFFLGIFCAIISFFVAHEVNVSKSLDSVTLANLMTLAYVEDSTCDTEDYDSPCKSETEVTYLYQDCPNSTIGRIATISSCTGHNEGSCQEGAEYVYYDCDGIVIKEDSRMQDKLCK